MIALGDVRGDSGSLGVGRGGGAEVTAELVQVPADGVPAVALAEHLAQAVGLAQPGGGAVDAADGDRAAEHGGGILAHADWIIDLGPGAGQEGGRIVFEGTPADLVAGRSTLTGEHLAAYMGSLAR